VKDAVSYHRRGKIRVDGVVHQAWGRGDKLFYDPLYYCFCRIVAARDDVCGALTERAVFVRRHATSATVLTCFECVLDPDDPHGV